MARNPLTAVPATRSSLPLLQIRRRLVIGILIAAVVSGVLSTFAWVTSDKAVTAPTVLPNQSAISLAQTVVGDYLNGRKSSVPAASNVDNDFTPDPVPETPPTPLDVQAISYVSSAPYVLGDNVRTQVATVQEVFTAQVNGKLYTVTVPMVAAGKSWRLGAAPSIAPAKLSGNGGSDLDYGDLYDSHNATLPTAGYQTRINEWAAEYAKGGHADPALQAFTGDPAAHTYSGLGGWTVDSEPNITSVVPVTTPVKGFIVRISLVLRPPATNGPTLSTEYDLYITSNGNQTNPFIVAWGAAGSYRVLEPYMNADQH